MGRGLDPRPFFMPSSKVDASHTWARKLFNRLHLARGRPAATGGSVVGELDLGESDANIQRHQREFAWTITQSRCLTASLLSNGLLVALVLFCAAIASQRPSWMIRGAESPRDVAEKGFRVTTFDKDVFRQFAQATLPLLNTADKSGSSRVDLLHGIVAEGILERKTQQFERRLRVYQECDIIQTLIVDGVLGIWAPGNTIPGTGSAVERQRFGFYVSGRLIVHVGKSKQGELFESSDYRALLVVEQSVPNNGNPYPLFLATLEERKGAAAVQDWDKKYLSNPDQPPK